jgi:predicted RNA-binding protein with PUA-like domain
MIPKGPKKPAWYMVDVKFIRPSNPSSSFGASQDTGLKNMLLLRHGRLSVQPVTSKEWEIITSSQ